MRTTLTIDADVLAAAKGLARIQHKSVGNILSSLARQSLRIPVSSGNTRNGVPLLMRTTGAVRVTPELVNQLRDELPE
ncbi:MAG: CopG family transcriptional regulator [Gallionellales bacterium CG_4_10_14_3_um_filter_54_96]|nr:MAG: CopG family transcriptional regulator [Gallionellales bacterium CG17_big_fil_post_rev_8_21_14_2_50_54_146]PIX04732.1 MAG: CopG family transcriptional regulator [Gallionellales bacterium CG_4_8_14_3_um_filter_54_18]PIY05883.1 MAG: CopG family transcriptional regulator [Gallionellales bacterium CG_4_10_14_3_um_filter_54_96]PJC03760.1 MAG: CopG family transcriptional regulator [Gallionellales bacterium CG_4_9_14_0_8_um_filter_55_61]HCJ51741.1 CopG family transcriptional regulator [Gallione